MLKVEKNKLETRLVNVKEIVKQIHAVDELLTKTGLQYCAVGGTLLGCIRDKGFIPWDDDFDLLMSVADIRTLIKYKLFEKIGFKGNLYDESILIEDEKRKMEVGLTFTILNGDSRCDIFPYERINSKQITTNDGEFVNEVVFPFRRFKFETFSISVPQNPKFFLDKNYTDWDKRLEIRETSHSDFVQVVDHSSMLLGEEFK